MEADRIDGKDSCHKRQGSSNHANEDTKTSNNDNTEKKVVAKNDNGESSQQGQTPTGRLTFIEIGLIALGLFVFYFFIFLVTFVATFYILETSGINLGEYISGYMMQ